MGLRCSTTLLLAAALFGCGGDDDARCSPLDGTYELSFRSREGDCGDSSMTVEFDQEWPETIADAGLPEYDCASDRDISADGCSIDSVQDCEILDGEGTPVGSSHSASHLERMGDRLEGTFEIEVVAGEASTRCVADITYEKL